MFKKILSTLAISMMISSFVSATEIPVDAKLDYNQGIDFYKLGMYERAIESFRGAIRTYPDYIDAYYNLGVVLEYLKNYSEALNVFKQIYLRNPNDYEVGKRHNLKPIWVIDEEGKMKACGEVPQDLHGLDRYEAREKTVGMLSYNNFLLRIKKTIKLF